MSLIRSFGPAVARVPLSEALRAGFGAFLALMLLSLLLPAPDEGPVGTLFLIAPFGATAILVFAAPNSPLAQPWSAIVGNTVAALVAVAVCLVVDEPLLRTGLAVGLAIIATILCRAVHPPAGAVALTTAISPELVDALGFRFALTPVATGTALLVLLAIPYAHLTGRRYPFRQLSEAGKPAAEVPDPAQRLGLSQSDLTGILERYRQSFNLGAADLARMIGAAQIEAAGHASGPAVAEDFMSRDLVTVTPQTPFDEILSIFHHRRFTSLPVTGPEGEYLGVIFQIHLIDRAALVRQGAAELGGGAHAPTAREIMHTALPQAMPKTPIAAFLHLMAESDVDAVPVVEAGKIVGIVTRTDLVAALARTVAVRAAETQVDEHPAAALIGRE